MSALTWPQRHDLTRLLLQSIADPRRAAVVAAQAGVPLPTRRGFEPPFVQLSGLVLAADRSDRIEALLKAAEAAGLDAEALAAFRIPEPIVLTQAIEGAAPRPSGLPVQAPPVEGATAWLARTLEWQVGEEIRIRFVRAPGDAVGGAPAGHLSYLGEPFPVDLEIIATGAEVPEPRQTLKVGASDEPEAIFPLVLGDAEAIDLQLRCFSAGFEVGRGRYRLSADGEESGGALAVPNTVLEAVDEDAIKTLRAPPV